MLSLAQMLGNVSQAHVQSPDDWAQSVTDVLRDAAIYHQAKNGFYRAQCDALGVDPAAINDIGDLQELPLLPVSMFKRPDAQVLLTCSLADVETETRSSGTHGIQSVARRNSETMTRALVGLIGTYREFFNLSGGAGLFLNPTDSEASEMGLLKDFNILNSVFDHHAYLVDDQAFDAREAMEHLRRWKGHMTRHIVGPPFLINRLLRFLEQEKVNVRLDPYSMIITLGGWKRHTAEAIPEEGFRDRCHDLLGVRPANVRDMYGMIESNMLAVECHLHRKHVPPWCYISIRDPGQVGKELPSGDTGTIAILDALNTSYPGFLLTDDVGNVESGTCGCGRTGQVINFRRRGQGSGLGNCPVSIERYLDSRNSAADEAPALVKV
ncbi:acyl-protein synthetase [Arthrobacter sp. CAU 1506]|uniref:LuxE/PaaK family acyltransferase n=1 Tax=Arthrobacter sp. CAU 1506 TaxID=2560052 RepID=UPI0010ACF59A|nr:acyl-protein synthetase [Arthrobacter sp. CAU 1506]TJY70857.1 acyl-protein synthetase [Arthrobacter sp. CAU 1506]